MNYHVTGSVRLGHTEGTVAGVQARRRHGALSGDGPEISWPGRDPGRYPFLETHDLTGALYDPYDGDIDPAQLTQALAKGARADGRADRTVLPGDGVRARRAANGC
jgi:dimethylglycine dehydrogenase